LLKRVAAKFGIPLGIKLGRKAWLRKLDFFQLQSYITKTQVVYSTIGLRRLKLEEVYKRAGYYPMDVHFGSSDLTSLFRRMGF